MRPEEIFANVEKTHQPPRCKKCGKATPRLDQGTMICNSCKNNKGKDLREWL